MLKIAIVNGPNLNLLGKREPGIYGNTSAGEYFASLVSQYPQAELIYFQSNVEGELINFIHQVGFEIDGIVLNAGAYTHTSIAIRDAIAAVKTPVIEVHISNIHAREEFRHVSMIAAKCVGSICGLGMKGYALAVEYFLEQAK